MRERYGSDWHAGAEHLYVIGLPLAHIATVFDRAYATVKKLVVSKGWKRDPERAAEGILHIANPGETFKQHPQMPSLWVSDAGAVVTLTGIQCGRRYRPEVDKDGYLRVRVRRNCGEPHVRKLVHRLVLECFTGPCPEGCVAAHMDGSRDNNRPENLQWVTQKENISHKKLHGTWQCGESHPQAVATETAVRKAKKLLREGVPRRQIAAAAGVPLHLVNDLTRGAWGHVPWE